MQQYESQSPQSRTAIFEGSYSYDAVGRTSSPRSEAANRSPAVTFRYRVIKRAFDIFWVLLFSPVILLCVGIVAALVVLSSPGPIFYSHRRIRKNGAFFSMWKFRTMSVNSAELLEEHLSRNPEARAEWNKSHKLRSDPRITRVGLILRRYSIDEIPQLWNVLIGQMSLVGPRPIVAAEVEKYGDHFGHYCSVKPGLTGLWQVSGRSEVTYDERVQLDCNYVEHWSMRKDMVILLKTLSTVVNQDGAY